MSNETALILAGLQDDLNNVVCKYQTARAESFLGAAVCVTDSATGALALSHQFAQERFDANIAMAKALLASTLDHEAHPEVSHLVKRTIKLLELASALKTGSLFASESLH